MELKSHKLEKISRVWPLRQPDTVTWGGRGGEYSDLGSEVIRERERGRL